MITSAQKKELAARSQPLPPLLQIGKNGITKEFLSELKKTLEHKELVKVRMLKNFADFEDPKGAATYAAEQVKADLISCVGAVATFYKKGVPKPKPIKRPVGPRKISKSDANNDQSPRRPLKGLSRAKAKKQARASRRR